MIIIFNLQVVLYVLHCVYLRECKLDLVLQCLVILVSLAVLKQTLNVCDDYVKEYNILSNASKSKLMYFGKNYIGGQHVLHMSNRSKIDYVEQCVHLGATLYSHISIKNIKADQLNS